MLHSWRYPSAFPQPCDSIIPLDFSVVNIHITQTFSVVFVQFSHLILVSNCSIIYSYKVNLG
nr:MAG TPA: hypothetical protein [Caudoviricetes sp.]